MVQQRKRPTRYLGVNDLGYAIGESHARAKLTDSDIEMILWLHEQGLGYAGIAAKFDDGVSVSKGHVRDICKGRRRGQVATDWKLRELSLLEEHLMA